MCVYESEATAQLYRLKLWFFSEGRLGRNKIWAERAVS